MNYMQAGPDLGPGYTQDGDWAYLPPEIALDQHQSFNSSKPAGLGHTPTGFRNYSQMGNWATADATPQSTLQEQPAQPTANIQTQSSERNHVACSMCTRTFSRLADRDRHFNTIHSNNGERPWKCTILGCPASVQTWASQNGLRKHNKAWHGPYSCDISGCSRRAPNGFSSNAELQQHVIDTHSTQSSNAGSRVSTEQVPGGRPTTTADILSTTAFGSNIRRYSMRREQYPQPWSNWSWDDDNQWWWSRREVAFNTFEYEYQGKDHKPISVHSTSSRNNAASSSTRLSAPMEQYGDQYTSDHDPVSRLSNRLANSTLDSEIKLSQNHPRPQGHVTAHNTEERSEEFDPNYKTHQQWEFKWGRVFKTLWSEPVGSENQGGTVISEKLGKWGQKFTEKVRRFVIVDNRKGHCICLPIMTYGGQGCLKKGVHAGDHAIIYTTSQPARFKNEDGMTKKPIKVKQYSPQHKLEAASRLNYAKVYTIEYNVKVWFIGEIHKESEWWLTAAYNEAHPPLRPRGIPPPSLSGASTAGYFTSAHTDTYFPDEYPQHTTAGGYRGQPASSSTDNSLYPTWPQREPPMHNPGRMQDYPSGRMQDTYYTEGSSSQQALTQYRADNPPVDFLDYQGSSYPAQERRSNHRGYEDDDDLYGA